MNPRDEVILIVFWAGISIAGSAFLLLLLPSDGLPIPRTLLCLAIVAFVPLGRFPLSTLALEWNRHR